MIMLEQDWKLKKNQISPNMVKIHFIKFYTLLMMYYLNNEQQMNWFNQQCQQDINKSQSGTYLFGKYSYFNLLNGKKFEKSRIQPSSANSVKAMVEEFIQTQKIPINLPKTILLCHGRYNDRDTIDEKYFKNSIMIDISLSGAPDLQFNLKKSIKGILPGNYFKLIISMYCSFSINDDEYGLIKTLFENLYYLGEKGCLYIFGARNMRLDENNIEIIKQIGFSQIYNQDMLIKKGIFSEEFKKMVPKNFIEGGGVVVFIK